MGSFYRPLALKLFQPAVHFFLPPDGSRLRCWIDLPPWLDDVPNLPWRQLLPDAIDVGAFVFFA